MEMTLATRNREAQEELLDSLYAAYQQGNKTMSQIASELGITEAEVQKCFSGQVDLTMTEIRLLANTIGCKVAYTLDISEKK